MNSLFKDFSMRYFKFLIVLFGLAVPALAHADAADIPASATWYFHADIDAMRGGKASRAVYDWLNAEVFEEIRAETGIDLHKEADRMTAFAAAGEGPVIVFEGGISTETQDKIVALAAAASAGELQALKSSGKAYYFFKSSDSRKDHKSVGGDDLDIDIGTLDEAAYFSVAVKNKVLVTNTEAQMQALLAKNGKIDSANDEKGALFVLRAERGLIQAGVNATEMEAGSDWDSNILRNTKQVAVLLADLGEKLGFEAQLMTNEAMMANSIASIVRGLISLQVFNDDLDPEVSAVLQTARVEVADNVLKLSLALDPAIVVSALED
jgi:hypothetical protein